jgi:hypothetical protein
LADIFLSYASEDRERARLVAQLLEGQSLTVWWDRKIPAGVAYDEVIEREIGAAKYVVVLWSIRSIKSEWVKNEAASAVEQEKLIPVQIDDIKLPLEFRRRQTLNLSGWSGDASDTRLESLFEALSTKNALETSSSRPVRAPTRPERSSPTNLTFIVAILLLSGLGTIAYYETRTVSPVKISIEESKELLGTWKHHSGVVWTISKEGADKFSVKQTDPDKGLTMLGTAVRSVNGYKLEFEVLPAPVVKGKALLAIADSGNILNVAYEYEDGKSGKLVFRR